MFYSLSQNSFFSEELFSTFPDDAIKLSDAEYSLAYENICKGMKPVLNNGKLEFFFEEVKESIPNLISRAQGKAALIRSGLWQGVLSYVESIEDETEKAVAEVALNDTTTWQRSSPFLNDAAHALGLTDEQLDDLFLQASKIEL